MGLLIYRSVYPDQPHFIVKKYQRSILYLYPEALDRFQCYFEGPKGKGYYGALSGALGLFGYTCNLISTLANRQSLSAIYCMHAANIETGACLKRILSLFWATPCQISTVHFVAVQVDAYMNQGQKRGVSRAAFACRLTSDTRPSESSNKSKTPFIKCLKKRPETSYICLPRGTGIVLVLFYIYPIVPYTPAFLHNFLLLETVVKGIDLKLHTYLLRDTGIFLVLFLSIR